MTKIKNIFKKKPKPKVEVPVIVPCTTVNDTKTSSIERICGKVKTDINCVNGVFNSVSVRRPKPYYSPLSIHYISPYDDLLIIPSDFSKEEKSILIDNLIQLLFEVKGYL